jgi:hypothetical protein
MKIPDERLRIPFPNGGFEEGDRHWDLFPGRGLTAISTAHVAEGKYSLMVKGSAATQGAKAHGPMIPCAEYRRVELRGTYLGISGQSLGFWVDQFDGQGNLLPDRYFNEKPATNGKWFPFVAEVLLYPHTTHLRVRLIAYPPPGETCEIYLDDLKLYNKPYRIPIMPSQYKLQASEVDKLTAADVVGPDGVVYPKWTMVGVQGGIPQVPVALRLADLGAVPGQEISAILQRACQQVGEAGGGAILLDAGTFHLNKPVLIRHNGVVIRGAGRAATRLVYQQADHTGMVTWPNHATTPAPAVLDFTGPGLGQREWRLAEDGKRGDTQLVLQDAEGLAVGDKFELIAPQSPRFKDLTADESPYESWIRVVAYEVTAKHGNTITIPQPLRIDFPVIDESYARTLKVIERCGVEDLMIEHADGLVVDTIRFDWSWNCWINQVHASKAPGENIRLYRSKWHTISNSLIDHWAPNAYKRYGQYGGYTSCWDCLWENNVTIKLRHAPQVQFGTQGCVFRHSTFEGSDLQWHAGWCNEVLFENCVITSVAKYGSYGYGAYATGSSDTAHGPNGPRSVIYHCDFTSERDGICLWGVSEHQMLLHNRFVVTKGAGLLAKTGSFDHLLRHNLFILKDGVSPMINLLTPDCIGIEALDNTLHGGSGAISAGAPGLAVDQDNRALPLPSAELPPRPVAEPPSIYAWQNQP